MKNKIDLLYITIIFLMILIAFLTFGQNAYAPYSDIGRELYMTNQIKEGIIQYKELFNVYSPLSYWINAFIANIFGNNFYVFYGIGLILSILTIFPMYMITREYTNKHISFFTSLLIIFSCTFYPSASNWITPYTYAITYALLTVTWSYFFLLKYLKYKEKKHLYISCLLAGLSLCFKYEYICYILLIQGISIYKKEYFKPIFLTVICPFICLITLFIQGCTIQDLIQALEYMLLVSKSESATFFYNYAGILPSIENFKYSFLSLIHPNFKTLFSSICYINIILLLMSVIKKQKLISLILLVSIITSLKSIGGISLEIYGPYFLPLLLIGLISYIYNSSSNSNTNKKISIITPILLIFLTVFYIFNGLEQNKKLDIIKTEKGNIKIPKIFYNSTQEIINYINSNTNTEDKILFFPEGTFINYIVDRKTDNHIYYLIPPNNEIFGKEFIEKKINSMEMDYIITTNIQYPWFNEKSFMTGWGKEYLKTIEKKYKLIDIIGNNLKFYIFKRDIIREKD